MLTWFQSFSLKTCTLYTVGILLLACAALTSCTAGPQVLSDAVTAELVQAGFTVEQAQVVGQIVKSTAEDMSAGTPEWLNLAIDGILFAMIPGLGIMRNRSRATQMAQLKDEVMRIPSPTPPTA